MPNIHEEQEKALPPSCGAVGVCKKQQQQQILIKPKVAPVSVRRRPFAELCNGPSPLSADGAVPFANERSQSVLYLRRCEQQEKGGDPACVMQQLEEEVRGIQMNSHQQSNAKNPPRHNTTEEAGSQSIVLTTTARSSATMRRLPTPEPHHEPLTTQATCCKEAPHPTHTSRKSATSLAAALASSYCLLLVCAILGQCAPTGSPSSAPSKNSKTTPASSQREHSTRLDEVDAAKSHHQRQHQQQQHQQHHHHEQQHHHLQRQRDALAPSQLMAAELDTRSVPLPGHLSRHFAGQRVQRVDADEAGAFVAVQPVIVTQAGVEAARKQSSEQPQQQQREEANISLLQSAEPGLLQKLEQAGIAEDEEDAEQILLVLASELATPSRNSRLRKRSGISDQRLAEIQMIRALKKQLERAASKIAADSNGGGDDINSSGNQTAGDQGAT